MKSKFQPHKTVSVFSRGPVSERLTQRRRRLQVAYSRFDASHRGQGRQHPDEHRKRLIGVREFSMDYSVFVGLNCLLLLPITLFQAAQVVFPATRLLSLSEHSKAANEQAIQRGYPEILVRMMLAFQHLTVCTMTLTASYYLLQLLLLTAPNTLHLSSFLCFLRSALPAAGVIVAQYWTFVHSLGPWCLVPREDFPRDDKKANLIAQRIFMYPSCSGYMLLHMLMHLQHTWVPALPWLETYFYTEKVIDQCPMISFQQEFSTAGTYLVTWLQWGMACWFVRRRPPYPLLRSVWRNGLWSILYPSMILLAFLGCAGFRVFRESRFKQRILQQEEVS